MMSGHSGFTWIEILIVIGGVGLLALIGYAAWEDSTRPNMTLKRDDWQCVKSETRMHLQPAGKVMVPINEEVCLEYRRIGT